MTTLYNPTHAAIVALRQRWPPPGWLAAYQASLRARWYGRRHR